MLYSGLFEVKFALSSRQSRKSHFPCFLHMSFVWTCKLFLRYIVLSVTGRKITGYSKAHIGSAGRLLRKPVRYFTGRYVLIGLLEFRTFLSRSETFWHTVKSFHWWNVNTGQLCGYLCVLVSSVAYLVFFSKQFTLFSTFCRCSNYCCVIDTNEALLPGTQGAEARENILTRRNVVEREESATIKTVT